MESRTNELFKSYLHKPVITKTPSPVPQVKQFGENLKKSENKVLDRSITSLCTMMANCQVQLEKSNELLLKFISPDSDYFIIKKSQLKEFFDEFKHEITDLKEEIKESTKIEQKTGTDQFMQSKRNSFDAPIKSTYEQESSQRSLFSNKPLTPPSTFESLLENKSINTFEGKLHCSNTVSKPVQSQSLDFLKKEPVCLPAITPTITYKIEKHRKKGHKSSQSTKHPKVRCSPSSQKLQHTQKWLDQLPLPPKMLPPKPTLNKLLSSTISFKRMKSGDSKPDISDSESIGKWSCRSIRTYKKRRSSNVVRVDRMVRSEAGWNCGESVRFGGIRGLRSEY